MNTIFNYQKIMPWLDFLVSGLGITLLIAFASAVFGLIIGIVLSVMQNHKGFKKFAYIY
jgi:ABC-type amino acid transport system permease subunit